MEDSTAHAMIQNPQEALFLAARASRAAQTSQRRTQQLKQQTDSTNHERLAFLDYFRSECTRLQQGLDELFGLELLPVPPHNQGQWKSFQESVRTLGHECQTRLELTPSDMKMAMTELTRLQTHLDRLRRLWNPKQKFTFRRYRAALQDHPHKNQGHPTTHSDTKKDHSLISDKNDNPITENNLRQQATPVAATFAAGNQVMVEEQTGSNIVIHANRTIAYGHTTKPSLSSTEEASMATSVLIRNVTDCTITILGEYKAIHVIGASKCRVIVKVPVDGSIHVTGCEKSMIWATTRQLRVHDSTGLSFWIHVRSGPIIENCTDISFGGLASHNENENLYRLVKDFNWLKTLVPSPNFQILDKYEEIPQNIIQEVPPQITDVPEMANSTHEPSSDEEDEL